MRRTSYCILCLAGLFLLIMYDMPQAFSLGLACILAPLPGIVLAWKAHKRILLLADSQGNHQSRSFAVPAADFRPFMVHPFLFHIYGGTGIYHISFLIARCLRHTSHHSSLRPFLHT